MKPHFTWGSAHSCMKTQDPHKIEPVTLHYGWGSETYALNPNLRNH